MYLFENLQLYLQPVALPYTEETEQESSHLVTDKTQPNTEQTQTKRITQQPAQTRTDDCHADHGSKCTPHGCRKDR